MNLLGGYGLGERSGGDGKRGTAGWGGGSGLIGAYVQEYLDLASRRTDLAWDGCMYMFAKFADTKSATK